MVPSLRERGRSARLPPRPDVERYVHTVRDLMFPIRRTLSSASARSRLCRGVGGRIWTHWVPRGAFGRGAMMRTPFQHAMPSKSNHCSASVPLLLRSSPPNACKWRSLDFVVAFLSETRRREREEPDRLGGSLGPRASACERRVRRAPAWHVGTCSPRSGSRRTSKKLGPCSA